MPPELRSQALDARLLARAEAVARAKSCTGIWLDTYSLQAPGFYLKQGYEVFGTLDGPPGGASRFFYCKKLTARS